jgi:hypothetical protein
VSDLVEFLLARVSEDEAFARASASLLLIIQTERCAVIGSDEHRTYMHFDRHDPARVLAECAAKRAIVAEADRGRRALAAGVINSSNVSLAASGETVLKALAAIYASHPDYDQAWAL